MREIRLQVYKLDELSEQARQAVIRSWINKHAKRLPDRAPQDQMQSTRERVKRQSRQEWADLRTHGLEHCGKQLTADEVVTLIRAEDKEYLRDGSGWQQWQERR